MSQHVFTYAVGDLNGDHALLTTLLDRIHAHADGEDYRLVFLGNMIDGGPSGAAVLSALRSMELRAPDRVITLKGWHEALMTGAGDARGLAEWLRHGGAATLRSFGVTCFADLPREVLDWVARRPVDFRDRFRRYVGDPERALSKGDGLHLIHGCSYIAGLPGADRPRELPGATDIDTGAGVGGVLTAAILTDLQAEPAGYFQALPGGGIRFVPPMQPAMAARGQQLALRMRGGEPETAAAWSLRQDADLHAARAAMVRRASRRRAAWATAAGLVLVAVGGALVYRPAVSFLARTMAPETDLAATPVARAPETTASIRPAPPPAPPAGETALRTHALPDPAAEPALAPPPEPQAFAPVVTSLPSIGAAPPAPLPAPPGVDAAPPREATLDLMAPTAPPPAVDEPAAEPADVPVPPVRPAVLPVAKPKPKPPRQALAPSLARKVAPAQPTAGAGALPEVDPPTVDGVNPAAAPGLNPAARRPAAPSPGKILPAAQRALPVDDEAGLLDLPSMPQAQPAAPPRSQRRPAPPRPVPQDGESADFDPSRP